MKVCLECEESFDAPTWICPHCGHAPETYLDFLSFSPSLARVNDGWDPAYSQRLAERESSNFWFRARNSLIVWALKRYFPGAQSFLEVGCGTGFVLSGIHEAFPGLALSGSDGTCESLAFAREKCPAADFFQIDARAIPFRDEFDLIGAFDVLEHIEEDLDALKQIHAALRPQGGLLVTVPQHEFLWSVADDFSYHKRRYSRAELLEKLDQAGFSVTRVTSFNAFLLPLMLLSRRRLPKLVEDFDPMSEYSSSRALNAILESVLRLEKELISFGVNFPLGGTLLAVAQRKE